MYLDETGRKLILVKVNGKSEEVEITKVQKPD